MSRSCRNEYLLKVIVDNKTHFGEVYSVYITDTIHGVSADRAEIGAAPGAARADTAPLKGLELISLPSVAGERKLFLVGQTCQNLGKLMNFSG